MFLLSVPGSLTVLAIPYHHTLWPSLVELHQQLLHRLLKRHDFGYREGAPSIPLFGADSRKRSPGNSLPTAPHAPRQDPKDALGHALAAAE